MKKSKFIVHLFSLISIFMIINLSNIFPKDYSFIQSIDTVEISQNIGNQNYQIENFGNDNIKNVILILGDGVGLNHIVASRLMLYGPDGRMYCERLPVTGLSNTSPDDDSYITDSGAGGTALSVGFKTNKKMIGMTKDSIPKTSIAELMKKNAYSVGIVSTGQLADATPAAFTVKSPSRYLMSQIAGNMSKTDFNILFGGSAKFYEKDSNGKNAVDYATERGYEVCKTKSEFLNSKSEKILALIDSMDILNRVYDKNSLPTIAEVTKKSIELLSRNNKGFFLLIEEDGTDEASHNHDILGLKTQMKQMDDAIKVAVEYAQKDANTLVIVAADHETGGLNINKASKKTHKLIVSWATGDHTAQPVPVYSIGPFSYLFTGLYENTQIPRKIAEAFKLNLEEK
jgi:alkaline phosphatase